MPPRNLEVHEPFDVEDDLNAGNADVLHESNEEKFVPLQIRWRNVAYLALLHVGAVYGLFLLPYVHRYTLIFTVFVYWLNGLGITAGAHRLWTHRSYRAKLILRIFLAICNSIACQNDIIEWCRDHRVHHKYSETDADPHNAKRGFFFAHCGWLMVRKHPKVKEMGQHIDISDIVNDPVCAFQRKVYVPSIILLCFVMPTVIPWYFWGESAWIAYFVPGILRYVLTLNTTWLVNSAAHLWGNKPYDKHINPSENLFVSLGAMGEGFHNYHHTFPHDYATSEYGMSFNLTTLFIDAMAWIGLADQRRKMTDESIVRRKQRTGDGSIGYGFSQSCQRVMAESKGSQSLNH